MLNTALIIVGLLVGVAVLWGSAYRLGYKAGWDAARRARDEYDVWARREP